MNKLKPKPLDIINAAIAEIYGEQAVKLLALVSTLNTIGLLSRRQAAEKHF